MFSALKSRWPGAADRHLWHGGQERDGRLFVAGIGSKLRPRNLLFLTSGLEGRQEAFCCRDWFQVEAMQGGNYFF